jgi:DnaJ-class molecular chaperone
MSETQEKNYYELLGVPQNASMEQIQKVYTDLQRIFSPDSDFYADLIDDPPRPEHLARLNAITEAFKVLSDAAKRADYDRGLVSGLPGWESGDARENLKPKPRVDEPKVGFERSDGGSFFGGATQTPAAKLPTAAIFVSLLLTVLAIVAGVVVLLRH